MKIETNNIMVSLLNSITPEISLSGYIVCDKTWHADGIFSPYSRFYYVRSGEGKLFYNRGEVIMTPGNLYFIPLGINFSYSCDKVLEKLFFHVNIPTPERYDLFSECDRIISIPSGDVEKMIELYRSNGILDSITLNSILFEDIKKISALSGMENINFKAYTSVVRKAIAYINENLSIKLSVKEISDRLFISESKLSKMFRNDTGTSPGKYIDDKIMFEAEKLLANSDSSVSEVSDSLGFCDQFYFSRRFKEKTGQTPLQYRKKSKNLYGGDK